MKDLKNILLILAIGLVIVLAGCCFNSGNGFYVFCGAVALASMAAYVVFFFRNKRAKAAEEQANLEAVKKASAQRDAERKALNDRIRKAEQDRNAAENKAKAIENELNERTAENVSLRNEINTMKNKEAEPEVVNPKPAKKAKK